MITSITAQNTLGVSAVHDIPPDMVAAQIDAVLADLKPVGFKIGMLSSTSITLKVVEKLQEHNMHPVVLDPVMISTTGVPLLSKDAEKVIAERLLPLCEVVTPNSDEATALTGIEIKDLENAKVAAARLLDMGAKVAIVTGGHFGEDAADLLADADGFEVMSSERSPTKNTHGTGCTYSSALTVGMARGLAIREAAREAKQYVTSALDSAFPVGQGNGPVNHFVHLWKQAI